MFWKNINYIIYSYTIIIKLIKQKKIYLILILNVQKN